MKNLEGKRILVIDDEPDLLTFVRFILKREGVQIFTAADGHEGLNLIRKEQPDLVLLDIMMPGLPGYATCSRIIENTNIPIIFLTALTSDSDIVNGLNLGAVDYVTKPFTPKVLIARINAVLRFMNQVNAEHPVAVYDDAYLTIDLEKRHITVDGEQVHLTATEFQLFSYLFTHANQVMTFADILDYVWGPGYRTSTNYVHVYVSRLRKKIEQSPSEPCYLRSEPGVGYHFETPTPR